MPKKHQASFKNLMNPVLSKDGKVLYQARYNDNVRIGKGKFANVFEAHLVHIIKDLDQSIVQTMDNLVIKKSNSDQTKYIINEINILKSLPHHENIIRFEGATIDNKACFFEKGIMPFAKKPGDFHVFEKIPADIQLSLLHGMLRAQQHLLKHDLKSLDTHCGNWLIGLDGHIKLIDFGDVHTMLEIPKKQLSRFNGKFTINDIIVIVDALTVFGDRKYATQIRNFMKKIVDLAFEQSMMLYFVNGGEDETKYTETFFKLKKFYTANKKRKFNRIFALAKAKQSAERVKSLNEQIMVELEKLLARDILWKQRAEPETVRDYFLRAKRRERRENRKKRAKKRE